MDYSPSSAPDGFPSEGGGPPSQEKMGGRKDHGSLLISTAETSAVEGGGSSPASFEDDSSKLRIGFYASGLAITSSRTIGGSKDSGSPTSQGGGSGSEPGTPLGSRSLHRYARTTTTPRTGASGSRGRQQGHLPAILFENDLLCFGESLILETHNLMRGSSKKCAIYGMERGLSREIDFLVRDVEIWKFTL